MKKNKIFKFLSSVRLAVPLMLVLIAAVAYGTIVESRYNTEMARLLVYHTTWFQILLGLLWINILCAAISRWPFKKHHTGFIITHIGLLTLLAGSMITNIWGIDGQLYIVEKGKSAEVILPDIVLEVIDRAGGHTQIFPMDRRLHAASDSAFNSINNITADKFSIISYIPFAKVNRVYKTSQAEHGSTAALSFRLKSAFFDVNEWLNSQDNPQLQMGPAHLSLIVHTKNEKSTSDARMHSAPTHREPQSQKSNKSVVQVLKKGSGEVIGEVSLDKLKAGPARVGPLNITLTQFYNQAMVEKKGQLSEGGKPGANPAVELKVEYQGKTLREVAYAKYPTFTVNAQGVFGYTIRFNFAGIEAKSLPEDEAHGGSGAMAASESESMPNDSVHAGAAPSAPAGNTIEFHFYPEKPDQVLVKLIKAKQEVMQKWMKQGEVLQTPWMGMQITLNEIVVGGVPTQEVQSVEQPLRSEILPSAILLKPAGGSMDEAVWLLEGDSKELTIKNAVYQVYYGRKSLNLPFEVHLDKFTKTDYPGTQTPMSFESEVTVNQEPELIKIAMNEPLKRAEYTLYQASYILKPGEPAVTVLSVNWDPGRWVKYLGSLILVLGIMIFTLMRSRLSRPGAHK